MVEQRSAASEAAYVEVSEGVEAASAAARVEADLHSLNQAVSDAEVGGEASHECERRGERDERSTAAEVRAERESSRAREHVVRRRRRRAPSVRGMRSRRWRSARSSMALAEEGVHKAASVEAELRAELMARARRSLPRGTALAEVLELRGRLNALESHRDEPPILRMISATLDAMGETASAMAVSVDRMDEGGRHARRALVHEAIDASRREMEGVRAEMEAAIDQEHSRGQIERRLMSSSLAEESDSLNPHAPPPPHPFTHPPAPPSCRRAWSLSSRRPPTRAPSTTPPLSASPPLCSPPSYTRRAARRHRATHAAKASRRCARAATQPRSPLGRQ